ncbi:MAG: hypothetical protein WDZ62_01790 [Candidatus Pacearchaeota archaeon]
MKKDKILKRKFRGSMAIGEIAILIISVIAFSYLLGGSIPSVDAQTFEGSVTNPGRLTELANEPFPFKIGPVSQTIKTTTASETAKLTAREMFSATPNTAGGWGYLGYGLIHLGYAFGIYSLAGILGDRMDLTDRDKSILQWSSAGAYLAGAIITKIAVVQGSSSWLLTTSVSFLGLSVLGLIGMGVAILLTLLFSSVSKNDSVTFSCLPWDAPTNGDNCEVCNDEDIPCTEYRCMSLGTHCEYLKEERLCVFDDAIDTNPVVIEPNEDVLTQGYTYTPDNVVSPPNRGVKIVPEENLNGCVSPFTPLKFGVNLFNDTSLEEPRPARCKLSSERPDDFDDMNIWLSNGLVSYDHSFQMNIPSIDSLSAENISLREGGEFSVYLRCETRQGYRNTNDFIFNFCVDDGPNTWEPEITRTSIVNNSFISHFSEEEEREVDVTIFTSEPSQCRWNRGNPLAYEDMPEENQINCPASLSATRMESQGDYRCEGTTLKGLLNNQNNDYYISCIDQPHLEGTEEEHDRNSMQVPYHFRLRGTEPLVISSSSPNNVSLVDSTQLIRVNLEVETFAGADRGNAICSFSPSGENKFVRFFETGTHEHKQPLDHPEGDYSYDIRCTDDGGNSDSTQINFTVETDTTAPRVVRVFKESNNLKIITNEGGKCVYDTVSCNYNFEVGIGMSSSNSDKSHTTGWDANKNFYIKCEDEFGNRPAPNQCSITVRPFDVA